ncbi:MAG: SUMF1/EgtB/PvdO family nonheme iron enzyme [Spirochaetales bacterium]|nr:formylglycine-generating enzyme family protein [Spirochaetia bacterium]MDD7014716.1 SUMF1/EgtB/PvdO family nonheme iron enzyme [Spirochaetales bacterium]
MKVKVFFVLLAFMAKGTLSAFDSSDFQLIQYGGKKVLAAKTQIVQKEYENLMGENPSVIKNENLPVENVSWCDAIYFCNKLSEAHGLVPVYSVNGKTDASLWNYTPHKRQTIKGQIQLNENADGYRLPSIEEWQQIGKEEKCWEWCYNLEYKDDGCFCNFSGNKFNCMMDSCYNFSSTRYYTITFRVVRSYNLPAD